MNPLGEFSRQPLILGLDFHLIFIFYLHRALYKIHTWKFFVYGNIIARGKIKCGKKSLGEKKGPKKKEMVPFCQEKKKNSFVKAVGTSSTLASRFRTKKSPSNQHLPYVMVIIVSSSSTLVVVYDGLLFPGNLDSSSLTPGGSLVLLVCGKPIGGEKISWRGSSCLRTFMS